MDTRKTVLDYGLYLSDLIALYAFNLLFSGLGTGLNESCASLMRRDNVR